MLAEEAAAELKTVMGYGGYLKTIRGNAAILESTGIFASSADSDSFSSRNIKKTVNDFASMDSINPQYDIAKGIKLITDSPISVLFTLIAILFICLSLITDEKDKGLFAIVKTTQRGSLQTAAAKLVTLFIFVVLVSALFYGSSLIFAESCYGLGDISRPVQSLPLMMSSILPLNVGQYLLLYFATETLGFFVIGLLITLFAILSKSPVFILVYTFLTAAISAALYIFIPMSSDFNWFKIVNLVNLAMPGGFFNSYLNLNFFGNPISASAVFVAFFAILGLGLILLFYLSFVKCKPCNDASSLLQKMFDIQNKRLPRGHIHATAYEWRKIAFINMALPILLLFSVFQIYTVQSTETHISPEESYYKHYMLILQGNPSAEKKVFIEKEQARLDEAEEKYRSNEKQLNSGTDPQTMGQSLDMITNEKELFNRIVKRYQYVETHKGTQMIYDTGYDDIFGISSEDAGLVSGIKLTFMLILCMCGVFSIEETTGMNRVLRATSDGMRSIARLKIFVSAIITFIAFLLTYIPDLLLIYKSYGFPIITASVSSLPEFEGWSGSILNYFITLFIVRLLFFFGIMLFVLALSSLIKNNVYTCITAALIFLTFPMLHLLKLNMFDGISLVPFLLTNPILKNNGNAAATIARVSLFAILSLYAVFICLYGRPWMQRRNHLLHSFDCFS